MEDTQINLNSNESIVLFEMLSRCLEKGDFNILDISEEHILSILLGKLESALVVPFKKDYLQILEEARKSLKNKYGESYDSFD